MALGDPLVLKDSALVDHNFDIVASGTEKSGTVYTFRVDRASAAATPNQINIKQTLTGRGSSRLRKTLIQNKQTKINATSGALSELTTNLTWVFPLNGDVTLTDLYNSLCYLADLVLTTGSLAVDTAKVGYLTQGQS